VQFLELQKLSDLDLDPVSKSHWCAYPQSKSEKLLWTEVQMDRRTHEFQCIRSSPGDDL